jgi:DNA repair photolyase
MKTGGKKGRGASFNTPNRFEALHREPLPVESGEDDQHPSPTKFFEDSSKSILARNDSPDLPFEYSLNPYRGCEHGCIYCYARPSHEYLGFSAGLDFETKIMVKTGAAMLLRAAFRKKSWVPQMVALSGNTDCYQPVERKLLLTRQCLEVFRDFRNPVGIITKNALILRDIDILEEMAHFGLVHVMMSVTSLDSELIRVMEPRTSTPAMRLQAIEELAKRGIPVGINAAPIIPGLTDEEIPAILREGAARGATSAGTILLRLPGPVEPLFVEWLARNLPDRAGKITNRIRETRAGEISDSRFGTRFTGEGEIAGAIMNLYRIHVERHSLGKRFVDLRTDLFRRDGGEQGELWHTPPTRPPN